MSARATTFSTTRSPAKARPRGESKAERRLKRELGNKEALLDAVRAISNVSAEFLHGATTNPVIGFAAAVIITDILHRAQVIGDVAYVAIISGVGALELGAIATALVSAYAGVAGGAANIIPSIGGKSYTAAQAIDLIATANNTADARALADWAHRTLQAGKPVTAVKNE